MGFLDSLFNGLHDFAESDTAKRMMEKAEQAKAAEIHRTTGINGLRCTIDSLVNEGYIVCCEGTVKNIGRSTYSEVTVNVVYKNENGKVVDKIAYPVIYGTTLDPGESMPFRVHSNARNVRSASASVSSFEEC